MTRSALALYVHLPWCIRKCPYCDFNAHPLNNQDRQAPYIQALLTDFKTHVLEDRIITSIFFGGGTPSLFRPQLIQQLLDGIKALVPFKDGLEITLEANPGAMDQSHLAGYLEAGVNRLSIGVQSFCSSSLKALGRIHNQQDAHQAMTMAKQLGYQQINLDIMFALPGQSPQAAIDDLTTAIDYAPQHISWYELTYEKNTLFYIQKPKRMPDEARFDLWLKGQKLLMQHGYPSYEVSAYASYDNECQHNKAVWQYQDYLGIGCGAHSKLSDGQQITRMHRTRHPNAYLKNPTAGSCEQVHPQDRIFEFMLNCTRLTDGFSARDFENTTYLPFQSLEPRLLQAVQHQWIKNVDQLWTVTKTGRYFLNDLQTLFLPNKDDDR
jgi:putative oxygen-independent coproporphyrinogen III oxidase